jgi:hypothetical protein
MNADPANAAKRRATIARWSPEQRQAKVEHLRIHQLTMGDEEKERRKARGYELATTALRSPEAIAKRLSKASQAGRKRSQTLLAGIPEDRWPDYRRLMNKGHMTAREARRMILEETPGTVEHARRSIANANDAMRIRHERDLASRY